MLLRIEKIAADRVVAHSNAAMQRFCIAPDAKKKRNLEDASNGNLPSVVILAANSPKKCSLTRQEMRVTTRLGNLFYGASNLRVQLESRPTDYYEFAVRCPMQKSKDHPRHRQRMVTRWLWNYGGLPEGIDFAFGQHAIQPDGDFILGT